MPYSRILLIDDDEADQRIFATVLQAIGPKISCTVSDDALQALYQLISSEITADLIFLDVGLPGMTGLEFLQELRNQDTLKETPVVVMTGLPNSDDMRQTKELGALDYVVKPGKFSELREILSSFLR
ncbi:MAG TPA: response regulator [Puia sp.]